MADEPKQATGPGTFMWNELATRDLDAAKKFYGELLGWSYEEQEMAPGVTYNIVKVGEQQIGGLMAMSGDVWGDMPSHWMAYVRVDDTHAIAKKAGDGVKIQPFETPVGAISVLADPSGAVRLTAEARCRGRITTERSGNNGFGYDPLFLIPEYHRTFGELSPTVKQQLSHRARAFRQLIPPLVQLFGQAFV